MAKVANGSHSAPYVAYDTDKLGYAAVKAVRKCPFLYVAGH